MRVSHVDPLRKEYPELASMLADPPDLIGKRARFFVVVKDQRGDVERARARAWTEPAIDFYRGMDKAHSRVIADCLTTGFVSAVEAGDLGALPKLMEADSPEECGSSEASFTPFPLS
jgi:hypothetical protein